MDCYVVYPAGYDAGADWNGAVIIVYDIYGLDPAFQNMRANADRLAANGLAVFVPDFFRGSGRMVTDPRQVVMVLVVRVVQHRIDEQLFDLRHRADGHHHVRLRVG